MGTSKSYGGPRGKDALLPSWAGSGEVSLEGQAQDEPNNINPAFSNGQGDIDVNNALSTSAAEKSDVEGDVIKSNWKSASSALTRAIRVRGYPDFSTKLSKAANAYSRASRGGGKTKGSSPTAVRATTNFVGFISSAANSGFKAALESIGLGNLVGEDPSSVISELCDIFAPDSSTREDIITRQSILETLEEVLQRVLAKPIIVSVEVFTEDDVKYAIQATIATYVYRRWLADLGKRIEKANISPKEAHKLELEIKDFIREIIIFDFKTKNIMAVNWKGEEGRSYTESLYKQAFDILGAEE